MTSNGLCADRHGTTVWLRATEPSRLRFLAGIRSVASGTALGLGTGHDVALVEAFRLGGAARCPVRAEALDAVIVDAPPRRAVGVRGDGLGRPLRARLGRGPCKTWCARSPIWRWNGCSFARPCPVVGHSLLSCAALLIGKLVLPRVSADGDLPVPFRNHLRDLGTATLVHPSTKGRGLYAGREQRQQKGGEQQANLHVQNSLAILDAGTAVQTAREFATAVPWFGLIEIAAAYRVALPRNRPAHGLELHRRCGPPSPPRPPPALQGNGSPPRPGSQRNDARPGWRKGRSA